MNRYNLKTIFFEIWSYMLWFGTFIRGDKMKIGVLVRCIYTDELLVITSEEVEGYFDVYAVGTGSAWLMPKEHLEVIKCK